MESTAMWRLMPEILRIALAIGKRSLTEFREDVPTWFTVGHIYFLFSSICIFHTLGINKTKCGIFIMITFNEG
ncbi:MAG: hypothetical protein LBF32_00335 [Streptococcaceae bacterium]|nr:hypothetical protein [Streptococcaceae bacterium]